MGDGRWEMGDRDTCTRCNLVHLINRVPSTRQLLCSVLNRRSS